MKFVEDWRRRLPLILIGVGLPPPPPPQFPILRRHQYNNRPHIVSRDSFSLCKSDGTRSDSLAPFYNKDATKYEICGLSNFTQHSIWLQLLLTKLWAFPRFPTHRVGLPIVYASLGPMFSFLQFTGSLPFSDLTLWFPPTDRRCDSFSIAARLGLLPPHRTL